MNNRNLKCPFCGFTPEYGVHVCQGCQAEVLYTPTIKEYFSYGLFFSLVSFGIVLWIESKTHFLNYFNHEPDPNFYYSSFPTNHSFELFLAFTAIPGFVFGIFLAGKLISKVRFIRHLKHNR